MVNANNQYEHTKPRRTEEPTEILSTLRRQSRQQATQTHNTTKYVVVSMNRSQEILLLIHLLEAVFVSFICGLLHFIHFLLAMKIVAEIDNHVHSCPND